MRNTCYQDDCSRFVHAQGLCYYHYTKQRLAAHAAGKWDPVEVDAEPFKARIREFLKAGYSISMLEAVSGIERNTLSKSLNNDRKTAHLGNVEKLESTPIIPLYELWRKDIGVDYRLPLYLATRRVQALMAMGWTTKYIGNDAGLTQRTVIRMAFGEDPQHILRSTFLRLNKTYDRLSMETPPPCPRPSTQAKYRKWPLPLEWDEDALDLPGGENFPNRRARARMKELEGSS